MKLITAELRLRLLKNGEGAREGVTTDHFPVVKWFSPVGAATWLITEIDPNDQDVAFGLCDLGMGEPELGYVNVSELEGLVLKFGLKIERDLYFQAAKPISEYAKEARLAGRIVA